jgi:hypothetical protein
MIGCLPKQLNINGVDRAIWSDFRTALLIFQACADPELDDQEKAMCMIECLFQEPDSIPPEDMQEANEKASWFLEGGAIHEDEKQYVKKIMDWEQDEQIIFSAVNKVAGRETRDVEYLHWWTFLGYMKEIGEGLFTTVTSIRKKQNSGKKLEKYEQDFYRENKALIDLKNKLSQEEQARQDNINNILR